MKVGIVHGRFQPFHNGHLFLVREMMKQCDIGLVVIGSCGKADEKNIYSDRERFLRVYKKTFSYSSVTRLYIGFNCDFRNDELTTKYLQYVLISIGLTLCCNKITDVFCGPDYSVQWDLENITIHRYNRFLNISSTKIRERIKRRK